MLTGTSDEWEKTNDKFSGYSGTNYPKIEPDLSEKVGMYRKNILNYGSRVTPWQPAPEDVGLKSELAKIKQAIINLGGSV